jgi:hypothetical protein
MLQLRVSELAGPDSINEVKEPSHRQRPLEVLAARQAR